MDEYNEEEYCEMLKYLYYEDSESLYNSNYISELGSELVSEFNTESEYHLIPRENRILRKIKIHALKSKYKIIRPPCPFYIFYNMKLRELQNNINNNGIKNNPIELNNLWANLSDKEKNKYNELYYSIK